GTVAWSPIARANVGFGADSEQVEGFLASGSFFDVLGVRPILGRTFSGADDRRGGGPDGPVAVISYRFWQQRFGGASDIVGRLLTVENVPLRIVGVTPPEFFGADVGRTFDLVVPLAIEPLISRNETRLSNPATAWLDIIARLKPDQTIDAATLAIR